MPRRSQPADAARFVALRRFHHPDGVALPGDSVWLRPDVAERAVRSGDVRPDERATPKPTDKTSTEETA